MNSESAAPHSEPVAAFFQRHRTGFFTLVCTDLVESTQLKQALGDQGGAALIRQHRAFVRELLGQFPGSDEIETAGDSFLLVFSKPSAAVTFALLLQHRQQAAAEPSGHRVPLRIGIHLGEVVIEEHETGQKAKDLYGIQIDTCARVMSLAKANQVLMSRGVFDNARQVLKGEDLEGIGPLEWLSHGPYQLKGIEESVEVCEVREAGRVDAPGPPTSSDKARRQVRPDEEPVLGWRPAVGQVVPDTRWVLEAKLGEGGVGEVWMAKHQKLEERRVFKFCFRADRVRTLKREVTLFGVLKERVGDHPHIVRLHDVYLEKPPYYLEEEYVEGKDLTQWCADHGGAGKVPLATRLEIVAQAAEALQAAHDSGIIHRDVKPGNILIAGRGIEPDRVAVKLSDFGVGQVTSAEVLAGVTRSGFTQTMLPSGSTQTGTLMYLAPELMGGSPATTRSDIYSLGVVLYQLVVGDLRHPLTADWAKGVTDSLIREDLDYCLAGEPEERFTGAGQLADNVRNLAERQRRREERLKLARRAAQRHRALVISGAATAALFVLAGGLGYGLWRVQQARELAEAHTYAVDMNLAQQALLADDLGKARGLLDRYQPGTSREHLRGFEWRYLAAEARSDYTATDSSSGYQVSSMALCRDGRTLAVYRNGGGLELWHPATLTRTPTIQTDQDWGTVAFSPTGNLLAASAPRGVIRLWQLEPRLVVGDLVHTNDAICLNFSSDGRHLASLHLGSGLCVWDVQKLQAESRYPDFRHRELLVGRVCFSPDGRYLAVGDLSGHIRILDWAATNVVADIAAHNQGITSLAYSADGKLLASGSGYSADEIRLWNPTTGELAGSLAGHRGWIAALQFSSDGQRLFSASADQTIGIWDVPKRRLSLRLRGHLDEVWCIALDEGRNNLISGCKDGTLARWDINQVRERVLRLNLPGWTRFPACATGRPLVAVLDPQGAVALWRPGQSQQLSMIAALGTNNGALAVAVGRGLLACAARQGPVRIWSMPSANLVTNLAGHVGGTETYLYGLGLRFSRGEDFLLAFDGAGLVSVWETKTWTKRSTCTETNGATCAALSADGSLLVLGSELGIIWWDAVRGHRLAETIGHRHWVVGLDFSPDGSTLASASLDGTVALWNTRTRLRIAYWRGHFLGLHAVAFSPDGTRLATGLSGGYAARLWDLKTRRELATLVAPGDSFQCVEFSPDGSALLCGSTDGHSYLWRTPSFAEIDAAEKAQASARPAAAK